MTKQKFIEEYLKKSKYKTKKDLYNQVSEAWKERYNEEWQPDSIRKFISYHNILGLEDKIKVYTIPSGDEIKVTAKSLNVLTIEDAIRAADIDMDEWEVSGEPKPKFNSWEVTMKLKKNGEEVPATFTNWQVTFTIKRKVPFDYKEFKQELIEGLKDLSPPIEKYSFNIIMPREHLFVFNLNDLHLGRLAWHEEVERDYDHKIAVENFKKGFDQQLAYASNFPKEQILFIVGNDLVNYDYSNPYPQTMAGTPMTSDARWQKLFRIARKLVVEAVNELSTMAPVHIMVIPGNHDYQTIFYLGEVLEVIYDKNLNVTIDNAPKMRKYWNYGQNLIGATHGNREKPVDLHAIMAAESRELMGKTKYWYFYMGHMHHEVTQKRRVSDSRLKTYIDTNEDYKGLIIDWLPNLAHRDAYEFNLGFVGTIRSCKTAIHHKEKGRIATFNYNL